MIGGIAEFILVITMLLVLEASLAPTAATTANTIQAAVAAGELQNVRDAASQYIKDNWSTVYAAAGAGPIPISVATLAGAGYLPTGAGGMNSFQQNHVVVLEQSGASGILGFVLTYGGNQIPANSLPSAVALIGRNAAYIPYASDPAACTLPCIKSIGTYYSQSLAAFSAAPATSAYVPTSGHLAATLFFQGGEEVAPYLYRYAQPNNTDGNTMHTAINMNTNNITNAGNVYATQLTDTSNNAFYVLPSGTSNLNILTVATLTATTINSTTENTSQLTATTSITSPYYYHSSDIRLKKDICSIRDPLQLLEKLHGHRFVWRKDNRPDLGLIAQEVEREEPELVHVADDGTKSVEYDSLVAPLIEAVKVLSGRLRYLEHGGAAPDEEHELLVSDASTACSDPAIGSDIISH